MKRFQILTVSMVLFYGSAFFIAGCAKTTFRSGRIPVFSESIFVKPFSNKGIFRYHARWPQTGSVKDSLLLSNLDDFRELVNSSLLKNARHGGYALASDSKEAAVIIHPSFKTFSIKEDTLECLVSFRIADEISGRSESRTFMSRGWYPSRSVTDDGYYYWGSLIASLKRNFPADSLTELFLPPDTDP